jgi:hypothetical protein
MFTISEHAELGLTDRDMSFLQRVGLPFRAEPGFVLAPWETSLPQIVEYSARLAEQHPFAAQWYRLGWFGTGTVACTTSGVWLLGEESGPQLLAEALESFGACLMAWRQFSASPRQLQRAVREAAPQAYAAPGSFWADLVDAQRDV